jgi:cobaltochelatase CobT
MLPLLMWETLSGMALPENLQTASTHWRTRIGAERLARLAAACADQEHYARQIMDLLTELGVAADPQPEQPRQLQQIFEQDADQPDSDTIASDRHLHEHASERPWYPPDDSDEAQQAYRVFTPAYDEIIRADTLLGVAELVRLRGLLDQQLQPLQHLVVRLANRLQRRLLAQQRRAWEFDLDEGLLDARRLPQVIMHPLTPLVFKQEKTAEFRDTVVTLLIDNSRSMKGWPINIAAMSADILARTLERCGVRTEILGFTTRTWKTGRSGEQWERAGKPANPGRLNDLRHIIYKPADVPWRRARNNLGLMMRVDMLKQNIDGEALLWAHQRLLLRAEQRRILIVISDGAPVDELTLAVNHKDLLDAHLRRVIDWIERHSRVQLAAIGIGHDVTRYYRQAVLIDSAEQFGIALVDQLDKLFV